LTSVEDPCGHADPIALPLEAPGDNEGGIVRGRGRLRSGPRSDQAAHAVAIDHAEPSKLAKIARDGLRQAGGQPGQISVARHILELLHRDRRCIPRALVQGRSCRHTQVRDRRDRRDEPVSAPRDGFDEPWLGRIVP
jgi:hypothetical protein